MILVLKVKFYAQNAYFKRCRRTFCTKLCFLLLQSAFSQLNSAHMRLFIFSCQYSNQLLFSSLSLLWKKERGKHPLTKLTSSGMKGVAVFIPSKNNILSSILSFPVLPPIDIHKRVKSPNCSQTRNRNRECLHDYEKRMVYVICIEKWPPGSRVCMGRVGLILRLKSIRLSKSGINTQEW